MKKNEDQNPSHHHNTLAIFQPIELLHLRCFLVPVVPTAQQQPIVPRRYRSACHPPWDLEKSTTIFPLSLLVHPATTALPVKPALGAGHVLLFPFITQSLRGIREKSQRGREEKRRKRFSTEHQSHIFKEGDWPVLVTLGGLPPNPSDDSFPTIQLFFLAICRVAEPIALTSIFPYSWVMVKDFHMGDPSDASFYAGILVAAFSAAEAITGMFWGGLSDRVGRKPVLLFGCVGTMISLLVVGFSKNFPMALTGRIVGGLLNGNIGVIQTMVGELVKRPEHEPRAYAVMPFVWSIGTIIGPAIGGLLAKPAEGFPSVFSPDGLFGEFPFLLPNLICSGLLLLSIIGGLLFLQETHPDMQPWSIPEEFDKSTAETPLLPPYGATANASADLRAESYGTFNQVDMHEDEQWQVRADGPMTPTSPSPKIKVFSGRVAMLVIALGIFTYHSMTYDHLLPIFLQDENPLNVSALGRSFLSIPGGVGLSTRTVGLIMSVDGVIALVIQSLVFPPLAERLGVWKTFVFVTVLHPIAYFIVPFLVFLPQDLLFPGIYTCLIIRNFLSIIAYPLLLILIKQASPSPSVLGRINGLAASAGAACRMIAPPIAGLLYSAGTAIGLTAIAWWTSSLVALIGAFQLWFIERKKHATVTVTAATPCLAAATRSSVEAQPQKDIVHIMVSERIRSESEASSTNEV
ncbi:hypothetical protein DTO271G3_1144 [Paecilomyces variotii]|nr:hypothetical protein DTO271G3_1144 [Paecilomyces variotii]